MAELKKTSPGPDSNPNTDSDPSMMELTAARPVSESGNLRFGDDIQTTIEGSSLFGADSNSEMSDLLSDLGLSKPFGLRSPEEMDPGMTISPDPTGRNMDPGIEIPVDPNFRDMDPGITIPFTPNDRDIDPGFEIPGRPGDRNMDPGFEITPDPDSRNMDPGIEMPVDPNYRDMDPGIRIPVLPNDRNMDPGFEIPGNPNDRNMDPGFEIPANPDDRNMDPGFEITPDPDSRNMDPGIEMPVNPNDPDMDPGIHTPFQPDQPRFDIDQFVPRFNGPDGFYIEAEPDYGKYVPDDPVLQDLICSADDVLIANLPAGEIQINLGIYQEVSEPNAPEIVYRRIDGSEVRIDRSQIDETRTLLSDPPKLQFLMKES